MATVKSYTDLEQSKELEKILPFESADMYYINGDINKITIGTWEDNTHDEDDLPCWSLAALFSVLPQINEWITSYGHKDDKLFKFDPKMCKIWEHSIMPSYKVTYANELSTDIYDNLVDACVEMIIKLNEQNLL